METIKILPSVETDLTPYFADLGLTFDSSFLEKRKYLLKGLPKQQMAPTTFEKDTFYYKFISNQRDFSKEIKISATAKASYGAFSGKASAKRNSFFSSNSYSCYIFGIIKLVQPLYMFDLMDCELEPNLKKFIEENYPENLNEIVKEIGDEVIIGLLPTSELMVKVEIETSSKKQKEEITAKISASGTIASGSGKFSSLVQSIEKSKNITIQVYGNIPDIFLTKVSPEEIDRLLLEFPNNRDNNFSIVEFSTVPIDDVPQLIKYKDIFDLDALEQRHLYLNSLDSLLEDLNDWKNDINYVISDSNKLEFSKEIVDLAFDDLKKCEGFIKNIYQLGKKSEIFWKKFGENGNAFDLSHFNEFPNEFPIYPRIEPSIPNVPPPPMPKPKPRKQPRDRDRRRGDL